MKKVSEAHGAKFVVIHWLWNKKCDLNIIKGMDLDVINTLDEAPPGWEKMINAYDDHPTSDANAHVARLFLKYLLDEHSRAGTSVFGVAGAAKKSR